MGASEFALSALAFVLTYAIHSTLLLGLVCLVAPRLVRSLALRETLWKTAMFGGLFTALVQVGASMETPLFHWTLASHGEVSPLAADNGTALDATESTAAAPSTTSPVDEVVELSPAPVERRSVASANSECSGAHEPCSDAADSTSVDSTSGAPAWLAPAGDLAARAVFALGAQLAAPFVPRDARSSARLARAGEPQPDALVSSQRDSERDSELEAALNEDRASGLAAWARRWREWTAHGLVLWALFAAAVLLVFASMCVRLVRCMRGRTELESGPLREALDRLVQHAFPAGRRVRLYVAPELRAPVSLGWLRPAICVPPRALVELSADEQESMLAHELAHLVRRDPLWLSAAWLVERVFFFQPLHRVARAELHDLAELACDEWAARRTGDRLALASCLARIAEWIIAAPRALPATSMAEHHGRCRLTQRIERLLDDEAGVTREERALRGLVPALAAGLGALVLVAPGVSAPAAAFSLAQRFDERTDERMDEPESASAPEFDAKQEPAPFEAASVDAWPAQPASAPPAASAPAEQEPARALDELVRSPRAAASPQMSAPNAALDERAALSAELARLNESLTALRDELAPLREQAQELDGEVELARTLALVARRVDNLERRSRALREVIQVLETLESKPTHPSSTSVGFRGSRSLP